MNESREKWVHEDQLINHRLTWLGVTQGLLFTALGFAIHEHRTVETPSASVGNVTAPAVSGTSLPIGSNYESLLELLVIGIPYLGLITSILILMGTLAATIAMVIIKRELYLPKYGVSLFTTVLGWVCAVGIPVVFVVAWAIVIHTIA